MEESDVGKKPFVHLHMHNDKSLADAMLKDDDLAKTIAKMGMNAVAITNHGNMFDIPHFYEACLREKVKPILGMEAYVAPRLNTCKEFGENDNANYHLVLLSETNEGYNNLIQIASDAGTNGIYYKARTDKEKLRKWHKGIIASSACLGGEVQEHILNNRLDLAYQSAKEYNDIFGQGNFFLELQDHGLPEQKKVNEELIKMSRDLGIPLIATNDCHYLTHEDYEAHDVLMAIQAGVAVSDKEHRKCYGSDQFYVKTAEEMWDLFGDIPEALLNTQRIADRCNVELDFGSSKLPPFELPKDFNGTNYDYMMKIAEEGAMRLYGHFSGEVRERALYEADVIKKMGYVNYFLIVWDFFRFCATGADNIGDPSPEGWEPIYTGPGRGSGAGSIILYMMGITKIDPIRYNLLFERFLDVSRVSMPDIDSDFEYERRHEVIEYVIRKYGRNSVCQIITFGSMAARSAIRRVGSALEMNPTFIDKIAKMIPKEPGITINASMEQNTDLFNLYETDEEVHHLLRISMKLEGVSINTGTHAAGVLITGPQGVTAHVPVWSNKGAIVAQYNMVLLEELGLLKMDFLGLRTLGVIHEAKHMIKKNHGVDIDLDEIYECRDLEPLKLLRDGCTDGVFQVEGSGITAFIKEMAPTTIEDIIAGISLYRPGPMDSIPKFLENKRNPDKVEYLFPELENILGETYGVLVYQEQCMRAVVDVAGYAKSDSDGFRRVISKKKKALIPMHQKWFIDGRKQIDVNEYGKEVDFGHPIPGGVELGHSKGKLLQFFETMVDFAKYAFNKSHAAAYAVVAYCTLWLKYYYPVEFMAALMNSYMGSNDSAVRISRYISHCRSTLGIEILSPDVNISGDRFLPTPEGSIIYGLGGAKCVSKNITERIEEEREKGGDFTSLNNFFLRTLGSLNRQDIVSLACIGAFKSLYPSIVELVASATDISATLKKVRDRQKKAQLLGKYFDPKDYLKTEDAICHGLKEYSNQTRWALEREYLGLYLSGHPIYEYKMYAERYSNFSLDEMEYDVDEDGNIIFENNIKNNQIVRFVGMFSEEVTKTFTRKNKEKMGIATVEDLTGTAKLLIWHNEYVTYEDLLSQTHKVFEFTCKTKISDEEAPVLTLKTLEPLELRNIRRLVIHENDKEVLNKIIRNLKRNPSLRGETPVCVTSGNIKLLLPSDYWVNLDSISLESLNYEII